MGYYLKYRCEFDTIKNRQVRIDIEKFRNLDPIMYFEENPFEPILVISSLDSVYTLTFSSFKRDFIIGDSLIINGSILNTGFYTITNIADTISETVNGVDVYFYVLTVNEELFDESLTDENWSIDFTAKVHDDVIASTQSPLVIEYPNGKFDKMCPIRESKIRLKILTKNVTYQDFKIEFDTQFKIKIYIAEKYDAITNQLIEITDSKLEWVGWLDNDYITEPFLDTLTEIELSGNDGLSLLKTRSLADFSGQEVFGISVPVDSYITYCLYQTNLNLNRWTFINMFPEGGIIRQVGFPETWQYDAFYQSRVTTSTFLKGPRDYDDCYEILSKIMQAFGCVLFQSKGEWYIINILDNIYEYLNGNNRDATGDVLNATDNQEFKVDIGLNKSVKLSNADALLSVEKPFYEVSCKFNYDAPVVYFKNFDLLDGILNTDLSTTTKKYYDILDWNTLFNPIVNYYTNTFGYTLLDYYANIVVELDPVTNQEIIRYLALRSPSTGTTIGSARTTLYPLNLGDKVKIEFSVRETIPVFETNRIRSAVILQGNNNEIRYLGQDGKWYEEYFEINVWFDQNEDRRFWKKFNNDNIFSEPVPFSGLISIQFIGQDWGGGTELHFRDLSFVVEPTLNLSVTASGYEYKTTSKNKNKNVYDVELFLSNSDNISVMGALTGLTGVIVPYNLTNWQYLDNEDYKVPFAKYINRIYWQAMYRDFIRIEGRIFNIYVNDDTIISPLFNIIFHDLDPDKKFMITTLQIDVRQESAEFTSIELVDQQIDFPEGGINTNSTESYRLLDVKAKDYNNPIKEPKTPIDHKWGVFGQIAALIRRNKIRRFNNYS